VERPWARGRTTEEPSLRPRNETRGGQAKPSCASETPATIEQKQLMTSQLSP
jgi:hypothetical protein